MVATREISERVRSRIFRIGTLVILVAVAAAIIIPTLHSSGGPTIQTVGVVGRQSPATEQIVKTAGTTEQDSVKIVQEPSLSAAKSGLRSGAVDFVLVDGSQVLLDKPASNSSPADPALVHDVADYLGVLKAYQAAGLTPAQGTQIDRWCLSSRARRARRRRRQCSGLCSCS
jgi:ABC-2 type transport system permease protein